MKLKDHLDKDTRRALSNISMQNRKDAVPKKKPKHEKLSPEDLRKLMGENRQTYKRGKGGALRRK